MECNYYLKIMQGLPEGQKEEKTEELIKHIESCSSCKSLSEETEILLKLTEKLKKAEPDNPYRQEIFDHVTSIISKNNETINYSFTRTVSHPIFRFVITTAAILLLGLFMVQQRQTRTMLEQLYLRIENIGARPDYENKIEPMNAKGIDKKYFDLKEKYLTKRQIEKLLIDYNKLIQENIELRNYLRENYPEAYNEHKRNKKTSTKI